MKVPRIRQAAPQDVVVAQERVDPPYLTYALLAILVIVFACEMIFGTGPLTRPPGPSIETLVAFGGLTRSSVVDEGEWWRLLTAPFLHADILHLLTNGMALVYAGFMLEHLIRRWWFAASYLVSALTGALLSLATLPQETVGVGASGAILGLFGTIVVVSIRFPPGKTRTHLQANAVVVLGIVLISSFIPAVSTIAPDMRIDAGAHVGGTLGGLLVGLAIMAAWPRQEMLPRFKPVIFAGSIAGLIAVSLFGPVINSYGGPRPRDELRALLIPASQYPRNDADSRKVAKELVARYPRDPRARVFLGLALIDARDYDGTIRELKTGLAESEILKSLLPSSFEVLMRTMLGAALQLRGISYRQKGDFDRAIDDFNEIIKLRLNELKLDRGDQRRMSTINPFYHRGIAYAERKQYAQAIADFNEAVRLDPTNSGPYWARGRVRFLSGDFTAAIPDLRRFVELEPSRSEHHIFGLLWLYLAQRHAHQEGTVELAARAAKLPNKIWPAPVVDLLLGKQSLEATMAAAPGADQRCEVQFYAGELHLVHGERQAAIELLRAAAQSCPENFIEYDGARAALERLGE
jgi:rhomboid protease GluP